MPAVDSTPAGRAMVPAYIGWALGMMLLAASIPFALSIPYLLPLGLIVTMWVSLRAPHHRFTGMAITMGWGFAVGFAIVFFLST